MLRQLRKNKIGQNTAEYALLIALVVAGVIAMQTYAQRSLQARIRSASVFLTNQTGTLGNSVQYEPYYLQSEYSVTRNTANTKKLGEGLTYLDANTNRERADQGYQKSTYNAATETKGDGIMPSGI